MAIEDETGELDDNKRNINFYDKEAKLLDERIGKPFLLIFQAL